MYSAITRAFSLEVLSLNILSKNGSSPSAARAIFLSNKRSLSSYLFFSVAFSAVVVAVVTTGYFLIVVHIDGSLP
jgi:hypothetical protein